MYSTKAHSSRILRRYSGFCSRGFFLQPRFKRRLSGLRSLTTPKSMKELVHVKDSLLVEHLFNHSVRCAKIDDSILKSLLLCELAVGSANLRCRRNKNL